MVPSQNCQEGLGKTINNLRVAAVPT